MKRNPAGRAFGEVEHILPGGMGRVHTPDGAVLAYGVLPGEIVELTEIERAGKRRIAKRVRIEQANPQRIEASCKYAHQCGGCPMMHAAPELQREIKRGWVARAVGAEVDVAMHEIGDALGYRRRARLHVHAGGRKVVRGYLGLRSKRVIPVEQCPILHPALEPWVAASIPGLEHAREVWLGLGADDLPVLSIVMRDVPPPATYAFLERAVATSELAGASIVVDGVSSAATFGDPRPRIFDRNGASLEAAPLGFTQANDAVNRALRDRVIEWAQPRGRRVVEFFAGHGNLTVELAREAVDITAVEIDRAAVECARRNLAARGLSARLVVADAVAEIDHDRCDVVVLDPPRIGAGEAVAAITRLQPSTIVYVSCHPTSLGEDLRRFRAAGYLPIAAEAFDMFPQTGHVEAVVRLERARPREITEQS